MPRYLLTGAGFSRNWGGWLANEAFEYLLGSAHTDAHLRRRLWASKVRGFGFEDLLAEMQTELEANFSGQIEQDLRNMTSGVIGMFAAMAEGYHDVSFEPQNDISLMVGMFLQKFDTIFTLNQDSLLEQKYMGNIAGGRFSAAASPGLKPAEMMIQIGTSQFVQYTPDTSDFKLRPGFQPYVKLHGSFNWLQERDTLLIIGGNKIDNIKKNPLLSWYHQLFDEALKTPDSRLMIIGYSFNRHINQALMDAIHASDLRLFIIDPLGVDVIDKREMPNTGQPLLDSLSPRILGASRRPLLTTLSTDLIEHAKLMKFLR